MKIEFKIYDDEGHTIKKGEGRLISSKIELTVEETTCAGFNGVEPSHYRQFRPGRKIETITFKVVQG